MRDLAKCTIRYWLSAPLADALKRTIEYGLKNNFLWTTFKFKSGSAQNFQRDAKFPEPYEQWLKMIGDRIDANSACVEIIGHTSKTGPPGLNQRLSQARAEHVKHLLQRSRRGLELKLTAIGRGAAMLLVGTGRESEDHLDRRVEFKPFACAQPVMPIRPVRPVPPGRQT